MILLTTLGKYLAKDDRRDRDLMKRIQQRDSEALSELYDLYSRIIYGMILGILRKKEEAEDLLQVIFTQIWNKSDKYTDSKGTVYTWVMSLARNKAIDRLRSKVYKEQDKQSVSLDDEDVFNPLYSEEADPLENAVKNDRASIIRKALDELSEKQRKVIQTAYFVGMTQAEMSEEFGIPLGTVKTRMRDGMIKLREILEQRL
ncbi:sigma-70 family RNA polymerase sigma factor [Balneola sp. MJW-20]|uniref:sigma-70 family RNA polymerase sigma factor n=1 Tax=Gracilimonas aurantiaca TaxID=3234185 RepID=UPI00390928E6